MSNLAVTTWSFGPWDVVVKLQEMVLETSLRLLGKEHRDTLLAMGNMALTYCKEGRWEEAVKLQWTVFEENLRLLGEQHPDTRRAMLNLVLTTWNQRRRDDNGPDYFQLVALVDSKVLWLGEGVELFDHSETEESEIQGCVPVPESAGSPVHSTYRHGQNHKTSTARAVPKPRWGSLPFRPRTQSSAETGHALTVTGSREKHGVKYSTRSQSRVSPSRSQEMATAKPPASMALNTQQPVCRSIPGQTLGYKQTRSQKKVAHLNEMVADLSRRDKAGSGQGNTHCRKREINLSSTVWQTTSTGNRGVKRKGQSEIHKDSKQQEWKRRNVRGRE
jgi:hypothetical protein